jgi:hypothetical protein
VDVSGFSASRSPSGPSQIHPTWPFAAAPAKDRFGETVPLVRTAPMGAEPSSPGYAECPVPVRSACLRLKGVGSVSSIAGHGCSNGVQNLAFASASLFFETVQIHSAVDAEKNVLVYTVFSTQLINGSPFNSISVMRVDMGSCVWTMDHPTAKRPKRTRGSITHTY